MTEMTSDGGGRMMLRILSSLTAASHIPSNSPVISNGQARSAEILLSLARMACFDRFSKMANITVEVVLFRHGDVAGAGEVDSHLVHDRRRPTSHDYDPVGQERG